MMTGFVHRSVDMDSHGTHQQMEPFGNDLDTRIWCIGSSFPFFSVRVSDIISILLDELINWNRLTELSLLVK